MLLRLAKSVLLAGTSFCFSDGLKVSPRPAAPCAPYAAPYVAPYVAPYDVYHVYVGGGWPSPVNFPRAHFPFPTRGRQVAAPSLRPSLASSHCGHGTYLLSSAK